MFFLFFINNQEDENYINETIELSRTAKEGYALFTINCVGLRGITARGLVGPALYAITRRLNDKDIVKKLLEALLLLCQVLKLIL